MWPLGLLFWLCIISSYFSLCLKILSQKALRFDPRRDLFPLFCIVEKQRFSDSDQGTTCIPLSGVSFRVFVVQTGALGLQCCTAAEVLTGHITLHDPEMHIIFFLHMVLMCLAAWIQNQWSWVVERPCHSTDLALTKKLNKTERVFVT